MRGRRTNRVWTERVSRLVGVVVALTAVVAPSGAGAASMANRGADAADPLLGAWITAPVPMATIRNALLAARFTRADVAEYQRAFGFAETTKVRFSFTFYRKASAKHALQRFWNAAKGPSGGDDGFYELLARNRVAISSTHPDARPWREVFAYRVQRDQLKLRFITATNPKETTKQLRFDRVVMTAASAAPYSRKQ